ncbi:MAG: CD1871A family CXXC motif-containing protein [Clostridia bacterium]|nr:CD1871A family CXXC motif-containing protein [Clostridia bacterium]
MTKRKLYLALQAVVCIALVVLLSLSAISIYREGSVRKAEHPLESIYTPEAVAEKFAPIAPLIVAGLGLLIVGIALGVKDERAGRETEDAALERDLAAARVARPSEAMLTERRRQKRVMWLGRGLFALCMTPVLVYLLNPAHFPEADLEGMFIGLIRVLLPWTAAGLGALAVCSVLAERSALRETQAARERMKEERAAGIAAGSKPLEPRKRTGMLQAVVIVAAIVLIIAGALNGSARDVLYKAITICTECVGLG